jgi:hypothetical protein
MPNPIDLIRWSLRAYYNNRWVFICLTAIPLVLGFLFTFLITLLFSLSPLRPDSIEFFTASLFSSALLFIITTIINAWTSVSLIFVIRKRQRVVRVREALAWGWYKIGSYFWISALTGIIVLFGFILLIIPGIIFAVWYSLSAYVLVSEERRGIDALNRSKEIIRGFWWKVFWRFVVLGLFIFLITLPIGMLTSLGTFLENVLIKDIANSVNIILGLFTTPLTVIFGYLIYDNLCKIKQTAQQSV